MGSKRHQDGKLRNAIQARKINKAAKQQDEETRKILAVWALVSAAVMAFVAICVAVGGEVAHLCIAAIFFGMLGHAIWVKTGAGGNAEDV